MDPITLRIANDFHEAAERPAKYDLLIVYPQVRPASGGGREELWAVGPTTHPDDIKSLWEGKDKATRWASKRAEDVRVLNEIEDD